MVEAYKKYFVPNTHYLAFAVALVATLMSLSLSEIFHLVPCVLCWYQRICMYSLPVIIGVAIWRRERSWPYTVLPLAIVGWLIALYHTLLQWSIIPESAAPCQAGISCTTKQINYFGFITIPFGSFLAFTAIIILTLIYLRSAKHE